MVTDSTALLQSYRSLDPAGWVTLYRSLPMWAGLLLVLLGVWLLLFGSGRTFRFIAGPLGAVAGFLWVPPLVQQLGFSMDASFVAGASATLLVSGLGYPPSALFFFFGLPVGLWAGRIAGPADFLLGFSPAFLVSGGLAATFHYILGGIASSLVGAWALVMGALAVLQPLGGWADRVGQQPLGVLLAAGLFAAAGSLYQVALKPTPEEAAQRRQERARNKRQLQEKRSLEKRWANYNQDRDRQ